MTGTTSLSSALDRLSHAIDAPPTLGGELGSWRWAVRQRMAGVRDALAEESSPTRDGWLAARGGAAMRERNALLTRLGQLGTPVLESDDVGGVTDELRRLVVDLSHHCQRLTDLAYDEVELELGGSE